MKDDFSKRCSNAKEEYRTKVTSDYDNYLFQPLGKLLALLQKAGDGRFNYCLYASRRGGYYLRKETVSNGTITTTEDTSRTEFSPERMGLKSFLLLKMEMNDTEPGQELEQQKEFAHKWRRDDNFTEYCGIFTLSRAGNTTYGTPESALSGALSASASISTLLLVCVSIWGSLIL